MKWLIDEMLPPATAAELNGLGHDAISVAGSGLVGASDEDVYRLAVDESRTMTTENFADLTKTWQARLAREEPCVPLVFVRKRSFARGGGLAVRLARHLDEWAIKNPDPYPGPHWP